jgi:hypothetical protein
MQAASTLNFCLENIAMLAQVLWFSMVIVGINAGWQPLPEGGMEYIIQLDSQTLEALKAGEPIESDIQPSAGYVRSFKIILGTTKPPRISPPATSIEPPSAKTSEHAQSPSANLPETATPGQTSPSPRTLLPDPTGKRLTASSAAFVEQGESSTKSEATLQNQSETKKEEPAKPWMPLILVSLGLFASLGGNVYLTWIFADLRRRYRASLSKISGPAVY